MRLNRLNSKWLSIAYLAALQSANAISPPVNVALRSSWPAPPLLIEIIESAALENTTTFFPLLTALTDPTTLPSPPPTTPEAIHAFALPAVQAHLNPSPGALASFTASLALHVSTPKIEAFYQYYVENGLEARRRKAVEKGGECESWVDWYGEVVCDVESLARLEALASNDTTSPPKKPKPLPFDHIHPSPARPGIPEHEDEEEAPPTHTAILYASLSSPNFHELHTYLLSLSTGPRPKVEYILRYVAPGDGKERRTYLSGYGVSLDLKKMDYLALDDRHGHGGPSDHASAGDDDNEAPLSDEIDPILSLLQNYPLNESAPDATVPLTEDELLKIGLHATHLLHSSPSSILKTLQHLSQNFPKYATALARRRVPLDAQLEEEVLANHAKLGMHSGGAAGMNMGGMGTGVNVNMMWINGVVVDEKTVNPYALLRLLRKERALVLSLTSLGLSPGEAVDLLTHPALAAAQSQSQSQSHGHAQGYGYSAKSMVLDGLFDASDRHEGGGVIVWWNDIGKDRRYERWHSSIHAILRPLYPGQFPSIRLNVFNVVLALDLSHSSSLSFIAGTVSNIISRNFPFRFGVVPLLESEEGTKMARLFYYLVENYGRVGTMGFLERISQAQTPVHLLTPTVDWTLVRSEFAALTASQPPRNKDAPTDFDAILDGTVKEEYSSWSSSMDANKIGAYVQRLRVDLASAPHGHAFVNGKHFVMDDSFLRHMQTEVGQQLQYLQEAVYASQLTEENPEAVSTFFYDLPTTSLRRNKHIYPSSSPGAQQFFSLPQLLSQVGTQAPTVFVYPESKVRSDIDPELGAEESPRIPFTVYIVADLDSEAGLALVKEALESTREDSLARISFIHNPSSDTVTQPHMSLLMSHLSRSGSLTKVSPSELMQALGLNSAAVDGDGAQTVLSQEHAVRQITGGVDISVEGHEAYVRSSRLLTREFRLKGGDQAVIVNGRVLGPVGPGEFMAADFEALLSYELRKRTGPVVEALVNINPSVDEYDQDTFAHLVSMASSVLSASQVPDPSEAGLFDAPPRPRQRNYRHMDGKYTAFGIGDNTTALYQVGVLLDPLSEAAQKWAPLIEWLSTMPDVFIDLHINPSLYTEVPLKRFYRYNIVSNLVFDADGLEHQSQAVFDGLPVDPIYTLGMDVPPAWFVRPREAMYDLDNIQLGALSPENRIQGMQAIFDLDFLVVEGHARDPRSNTPPRGVQLQLMNGNGTSVDDTQIVATLGYFQFKTKPGVFQLEIREGRGRDIYRLESVGNEGWDSLTVEEVGNEITLTSFEGLTLYPRLTRKPGMEAEDVLTEEDVAIADPPSLVGSVVSNLWSFFMPKKRVDLIPVGSAQADINIFTVASGLLYERFVSIMILSVLRNTNSSVKFWFIENFLSPSFLEFIPHLAEAYGFQYELVTYKWPSWLRPQKEKQRIIWAYKILFLDVLFPMDLKKVIFVDADQIVRADLQELVDLDLHGAPYGYTPMGDDNTDMEGFRFWKTGYWKDFLQGRPYHISALYVIDLVKFRQIAAGDILRQQYHGLSADPNSLANLDQDLPNNLQREIPIYSLHEDWLWCETWCSKDRLHRAKTIDLCQNPLTKEPKLARARAIPEWEEYDSEIAHFARKLADEGLIRSNVAAVDVNVLANAGSGAISKTRSGEQAVEQIQPTSDSEPRGRDEL